MHTLGGRKIITSVAAAGGGVDALGAWVGIIGGIMAAIIASISLIMAVRSSAKRQDQDKYNEGYRDGINSCQAELWSLRGRLGITRAPYPPLAVATGQEPSE